MTNNQTETQRFSAAPRLLFEGDESRIDGNVKATGHEARLTPVSGLGLTRLGRDNLMPDDTMTLRCAQ